MTTPRLLITPGEPAGIGPDVTIQAAMQNWHADLIAIADPDVMSARAKALNLPLKLIECDITNTEQAAHQAGCLRIHPMHFPAAVTLGKLNIENAGTVLKSLTIAADACMKNKSNILVTGPVHKAVMNNAGIPFSGHTEFLAQHAGVKQTVMLFVVDPLKAALLTTHLPLRDVAGAVTAEKIKSVITILHHDLKKYFNIPSPKILMAGLNPHAGEMGHMGREEIDIIQPALDQLRQQGLDIEGPLPADTLFTPSVLKKADVILGMYHDQILPVIKYLGFDRAVNVTLGLPYLRTSVDHGTALSIAGTPAVNAGSMCAALQLATATASSPPW